LHLLHIYIYVYVYIYIAEVASEDVDEAMRLVHMSKASLLDDENPMGQQEDPISRIYGIIRDFAAVS
jgi:DNA replication licensing factor MCM7